MEVLVYIILFGVPIALIFVIIRIGVKSIKKDRSRGQKIIALGDIRGQTYESLCSRLGAPFSVSKSFDGKTCTWNALNNAVVLQAEFNSENICIDYVVDSPL